MTPGARPRRRNWRARAGACQPCRRRCSSAPGRRRRASRSTRRRRTLTRARGGEPWVEIGYREGRVSDRHSNPLAGHGSEVNSTTRIRVERPRLWVGDAG